jgi:hypothetical protein
MRTLAVLSLALGIGLAVSLASIVDSILLRPLPVARPSEIRRVITVSQGQPFGFVSYPDFEDFRKIAPMTAECLIPVAVGKPPQMKLALAVTADYFEVLGVAPRYGRTFTSDTEMAVILAHGSPSDLGRSLRVAGKLYTVIGIAPENFGLDRFLHQDLFLPIRSYGDSMILQDRARRFLTVHVRGEGREIPSVAASLEQEHPDTNRGRRAVVLDELSARIRADHMMLPLAELLGALAALILAVAIANACGASMMRAEARSRNTSIRIALGASPRRLFAETLRESAGVSALSCLFAPPLAWMVTEIVRKSVALPTDFGISIAPHIDGRVLSLMLIAASLASLIAPLCMRKPRSRKTLAIIEVALAAALIAAGGSCWIGLNAAKNTDLGYRTDHISVMTFDPAQSGYNELRSRAFYRGVLARARALPGVRQVALAQSVPLGMTGAQKQIRIGDQEEMTVWMNIVTPEYFDLMRMPLISGRTFDNRDSVIVNQELAKRIGIGEKLRVGGRALEVVGIVKTAKYMRWDEPPRPFFYLPFEQNYVSRMTLHIESAGNVVLSSEIPASDVRPLHEYFDNGAVFGIKAALKIALLTGSGGLLLALAGLYSVVSSTVSRRRREIAVRIALGAPHRTVFAMIVHQGMTISLYGTAAGLAVSRVLPMERSLWAAAVAAIVILATSLFACAVPAIRALRIDPATLLKTN